MFFSAALVVLQTLTGSPTMQDALADRLRRIEDRITLKNVVDTFSTLADQRDVARQALLFTEDATVDSYVGDKLVSSLKGRKQIGEVFGAYLSTFQTVYHHNGQQTVEISGDEATGISYCLVVLIGVRDGKTIRTTSGVYYNDVYARRGTAWLISKRTAHFAWQNIEEVAAK